MAQDQTDQVQVILAWANPHHRCILATTETQVGWQGDFSLHPVAGGEVVGGIGEDQTSSQISMLNQSGPTAGTIFTTPGVYPYFCKNHAADMNGTIYIIAAGEGGGGGAGGSM